MILRFFILIALAAGIFGGAYFAWHRLYVEPEVKLAHEKKLPPPTPPPDPSLSEFERCEEIRRTSSAAEARTAFERFMKEFPESKKRDAALDAIGEINSAEFFSTKPDESNTYVVRPGDSLGRVAARTKVSIELLVHLNKLDRDVLQVGQKLLAPPCEFRVVLEQKKRRVVLYNRDKFFRQYPAISWPGENKKPVIFLPRQAGKVLDKVALGSKGAVKVTERAYFDAAHVVSFTILGHAIYTQPSDPSAVVHRPNGGGIALAPEYASEIAVLLPKGAPATLE